MRAPAAAPPLPGVSWISGYMGAFGRDPLGMLEACARAGDVVQLRFGLGQLVLLSHPDLIEQVLVAKQQHFRRSEGTRRLRSVIGDGLLTTDGPTWLRHRRLTQPAFHRARINGFAELMVDYAD